MKKVLCLFALFVLFAAGACAQQRFIYGGSSVDYFLQAAVSPDGRIVMTGLTDSVDGVLSSRTGTGRAGWALCVDAEGNVLWSFTTQLSKYDMLRYPVFRADGSVTMLADTSPAGAYEVWWLHLDAQGQLIEKKRLRSETGSRICSGWGVQEAYQSGYVVAVMDKKAATTTCYKYTFDGEFVWEIPTTGEAYFPEAHLQDGTLVTAGSTEGDMPDGLLTLTRMGEDGWLENGFFAFDTPPAGLDEAFASGAPGSEVLCCYADRMDGQWRYALALLSDAQGYALCCGVYEEGRWQVEFSHAAIPAGVVPELIPDAVMDGYTPDTVAAAGGCQFFMLLCGDVTMQWGYQERWGRFVLGETVLESGEAVDVSGDTLWLNDRFTHVYHDFGYSLENFDASRLPRSVEEAVRRAEALPQSDRRLARLNSHERSEPHIAMHTEPDEDSPVVAYYLSGVDAETVQEGEYYTLVRVGDMQGYIQNGCVLVGGERAQLDYNKGGYPGAVYGGFEYAQRPVLDGPGGGAVTLLAPGTRLEILGRAAGTNMLQVRLAGGRVGFMDDTHVLQGFRHYDGYYTLRVVPQDGSDRALLYTEPDEHSAPIGACLAGDEVGRLVARQYTEGFVRVIIEGYVGYMHAGNLDNVEHLTQMP